MSKKTINVFEIYRAGEEIEILEVGCEYAKTIKNGIVIPHIVIDKSVAAILKDGRIVICYKISFIKELKEEFIKTLSNEFSGGYIIIAPDKKGLIVDFSLDVSFYAAITEKLKIKRG